jgi:hypothetical protein
LRTKYAPRPISGEKRPAKLRLTTVEAAPSKLVSSTAVGADKLFITLEPEVKQPRLSVVKSCQDMEQTFKPVNLEKERANTFIKPGLYLKLESMERSSPN